MPRQRQNIDPTPNIAEDGDGGWIGVNALLDPGQLEPGQCSDARNKRFSRGYAETRPGTQTPVQFNPAGGWGTIYGTGTFADPNGVEWLLIATSAGVYRTRQDVGPTSLITLSSGYAIDGTVELVQAFDRVLLMRGTEDEVLVWDGTNTGQFEPVPDPAATVDFLDPLPNADYAVVMSGRAYAPVGRDQVAVSDLLDYTSWDQAYNTFRINTGEDDGIVALVPFRRNSMIILKDRTMHRLTGLEGDLSTAAAEMINAEVGCVARRTVAPVGGDLIWLSAEGVMRLSETLEDSMQTQELPVSEPIRPWIERINWPYVHLSCARTVDRYYYLAVPIDDATRPNVLLVWDTITRQWQGMDTFPDGIYLDRLHTMQVQGKRRLVSVDLDGLVLVHGLGRTDEIDGSTYGIQDYLLTRGYTGQEGRTEPKRWRHTTLEISTWGAAVTVRAIVDGVREERTVGSYTPNRQRYLTLQAGLHALSDGAAHAAPYRQDYQVLSSDGIFPNATLYPEREQTVQLGYGLRDTGRYVQIEISSTSGTCGVRMCRVDGVRKINVGRRFA